MATPNLPTPNKQSRLYHSYLVRLWQDDSHMTWRVVAQSVQTGEVVHFADLAALFAYLAAQTTAQSSDGNQ